MMTTPTSLSLLPPEGAVNRLEAARRRLTSPSGIEVFT
jgi:hypothetical protein